MVLYWRLIFHDPGPFMPHAHDHHCTGHHHGQPGSRAFVIAIALNSLFVAVEFVYGLIAGSTALMADAGHNLSDVLGLLLSLLALVLVRKAPNGRYTYGLRSTSILAALANAMFLMAACGAIAFEAVQRLFAPHDVDGWTVMLVASVGIAINGLSAWLFMKEGGELNVRGAYLHMLLDALVSLGVVLSGLAMMYTHYLWLDSAASLAIVAIVVLSTWRLLKESLRLALNAVPSHIDVAAIENYLRQYPGVSDIHDLHIWGMSTTESALTVHLVMPAGYPGDACIDEIALTLKERYRIEHCTLQVEEGSSDHYCVLHAAH